MTVNRSFWYCSRLTLVLGQGKRGDTALCVQNHLKELKRKHEELDVRLGKMQSSPSCDNLKIIEVKKQKFVLKAKMQRIAEDMSRLQNSNRVQVGVMPAMTLEDLKENPEPKADISASPSKRDENQIAA